MEIILTLLPYILCAGVPSFIFLRKNVRLKKGHKKEMDDLKAFNKRLIEAEKAKAVIRNKQNEIEEDIVDNPSGDHDVVPVSTKKPRHNHARSATCGEGCPAHSGD